MVQVKTILKTLTASNRNDWDKVLAIATFSAIDLLSSTGLRIRVLVYSTSIVQNELICGYANVLHTLSSFHPHAHTLKPFEDGETMGLKVDTAEVFFPFNFMAVVFLNVYLIFIPTSVLNW